MPQQMIWFFVSIAFSFIAWGVVAAQNIWPELRFRQRAEALRLLRIIQAGLIVADYTALMVEILKDNARLEAGEVYGAMDMG